MSRKKTRDLSAVFFVGLFLMTREPVFLWLLAGSFVLLQGDESHKVSKEQKFVRRMKMDAKTHGLKLPSDRAIRQSLKQVYESHDQSVRDYPHLKSEYGEILETLWRTLSKLESLEEWTMAIHSALASWPSRKAPVEKNLQTKLKEVGQLSRQWDEARNEAFGGQGV